MRRMLFILAVTAGLAGAARADLGWGFGTGFRIPGSDISIGLDYHRSRWGEHTGIRVHVDPSRRGERREAPRDRDSEHEPAPRRGDNVTLRVTPGNCWVLLNGVRVEAFGRDSLRLPPGVHRLEFLRPGHRGLRLELDVLPGRDYWIEERLPALEDGERADPRLEEGARPVSVGRALEQTRAEWERADRSGVLPPGRDERRPGAPEKKK